MKLSLARKKKVLWQTLVAFVANEISIDEAHARIAALLSMETK